MKNISRSNKRKQGSNRLYVTLRLSIVGVAAFSIAAILVLLENANGHGFLAPMANAETIAQNQITDSYLNPDALQSLQTADLQSMDSRLADPGTRSDSIQPQDVQTADILQQDALASGILQQDILAPDTRQQDILAPDAKQQDILAPDAKQQDILAPDAKQQDILAPDARQQDVQAEIQAEAYEAAAPEVYNINVPEMPTVMIPPSTVRLVCVGDNLMHRDVSMSGLQDDGTFNYDYNFSKVRTLVTEADIAVINQECVTAGNQIGIRDYPSFNARTEVIEAIRNAGFDVVLAANNHILDMGPGGTLHMINFIRQNYPELMLLGIHDSWETRDEIYVKEVNGIRIGMINYTDILNNTVDYWDGHQYLVEYLDYERLAMLIRRTKEVSDFVIVFPHWGTEYNLGVDQKQTDEMWFLAAQGVDLVIGGHPHVVEPVQYVDRPDGGKMLVYYSLGNYQSLQKMESTIIGGMAQVEIVKDYRGTRIADFNMEFLATDYRLGGRIITDYFDIITTYPWSSYSWDIASTSMIGNGNPNFSLEKMFQIQASQAEQLHQVRAAAGLE